MFRTQGGGANRRRPISAAARRGNPPEFTNLGAPGHYSSEAKVWEGLHIMRDPPEATPGHKEVRSEEGKGGGGAGPWRVSPARTAMAVRGQIGLVAGLVSKINATRTRRRACSGPDVNYGLRHLVQKKERAVLVLTEGLWWPGLRRRWAAAWTSGGARRGGCGDGCCRVLRAPGLHEPTRGGVTAKD